MQVLRAKRIDFDLLWTGPRRAMWGNGTLESVSVGQVARVSRTRSLGSISLRQQGIRAEKSKGEQG